MGSSTTRNISIDIIRVTALFFVVLVHTHFGVINANTFNGILEHSLFFLAKLGVPLFVMISGTLLLSKNEKYLVFYRKRVRKILVPWAFWSIILLSAKRLLGMLEITSVPDFLQQFVIVLLSDFWFIPMILGLYLLTPFIRGIISNSSPIFVLLLFWFISISLMPFIYLSPMFPGTSSAGIVSVVISFSGYFVLGWYLNKYFLDTSARTLVGMLIGGLILYILGALLYYENDNALFFVMHDYFSPALILGSAAVFVLLLKNAKQLLQQLPSTAIISLSRISYGIFLSHTTIILLVTSVLPDLHSAEHSLLLWIIRAVLVYSSCALLLSVLSRLPGLKKLIT